MARTSFCARSQPKATSFSASTIKALSHHVGETGAMLDTGLWVYSPPSNKRKRSAPSLPRIRYDANGHVGVERWGTNTLNMMFRNSGLYSTGISNAPGADHKRYDTIFQERYMGLPSLNAQGTTTVQPSTTRTALLAIS